MGALGGGTPSLGVAPASELKWDSMDVPQELTV